MCEAYYGDLPFKGRTVATYMRDVMRLVRGDVNLGDRLRELSDTSGKRMDPNLNHLLELLICPAEERISISEALGQVALPSR